ncbi:FIG004453: protein YceG like [uncultured Gammaproteobacteria bacterium]|nr:FIG004453: protein YceG like [uncultured Gammaproteobacteria bacterium]
MKKLLVVIIAFGLSLFYWANTLKVTEPMVYHIPSGVTITAISNNLEEQGIIRSSFFVRVMVKVFGSYSKLKSGYYDVVPNMSTMDLLDDFASATVATRNITLVEGKTTLDYYQQLESNKALKSNGSFAKTMQIAGIQAPYEGAFWPNTYRVEVGDSVASVFRKSNQTLRTILAIEWKKRDKNLRFHHPEQALILASLIEKETAHNAEKSKIASVFMRRLALGMRLQTDPSVVYALGKFYRGYLTRKDLSVNSPYNTYQNKGLPPTPVASVGLTSLRAALHPASGDSLFFVAKKDGTHAFARTYKEHKNNIKKYLK